MSNKSLNIGISGLKAQMINMQTLADNLANVNTTGFKKCRVDFQEMFCQQYKSASKGGSGNLGGVNPISFGNGVQIGNVMTLFDQGISEQTQRELDFMVEGDDFLVVKNASTGELMLTRNGAFQMDGNMNLIDSLGNKVVGFNANVATGVIDDTASEISLAQTTIPANATTLVEYDNNINSSSIEQLADENTNGWEIFSGGETFGNMGISLVGPLGNIANYSSGYYQDNMLYTTDFGEATATANTINFGASAPTNLWQGFNVDDEVIIKKAGSDDIFKTKILSATSNTGITLADDLPSAFASGDQISVTNISSGSARTGSSGGEIHNDVLESQIVMVDDEGRLLASFYRVLGDAREYSHATATLDDGSSICMGSGEFSSMAELKNLMELALKDLDLTYADQSTTKVEVNIDKYEKITFEGNGMVEKFRLAINQDNSVMKTKFDGFTLSSTELANSQAIVDISGVVQNSGCSLGLGTRDTMAATEWYNTGIENYGFNETNKGTAYGEYAGLKFIDHIDDQGNGKIKLSLVNAFGEEVFKEFMMVPRGADISKNEFSSMGELTSLIEQTLTTREFSSIINEGVLSSDNSVSVSFEGGRLSIFTQQGIFNNLKIEAMGEGNPEDERTDKINFENILGKLASGVSGKRAFSGKIIEANEIVQTQVFDNKGNEHFTTTYFVKDQTTNLEQIEWKFKVGLNPNINHQVTNDSQDPSIYVRSYNSQGSNDAQGTIAFDINTGKIIDENSGQNENYTSNGLLTFSPKTNQATAGTSSITFNFSNITSFNGTNSISGNNVDGFAMGELLKIQTEQNTGAINGLYSNGQTKILAKIGLMNIDNAQGLLHIGSSYFTQTVNSNKDNVIKTIGDVKQAADGTGSESGSRVHGGALESSNADIAEELTNMIKSQRSFGAFGKIISTSDEMLQEITNLKR